MNPEIKAQWVAALRSGDYKQTSGVLKSTHNEYCCLGVLCDLALQAGATKISTEVGEDDNHLYGYGYGPSTDFNDADVFQGSLPKDVREWAGLDVSPDSYNDNPEVVWEGQARSLISLNDSEGLSFSQIADAIEGSDL